MAEDFLKLNSEPEAPEIDEELKRAIEGEVRLSPAAEKAIEEAEQPAVDALAAPDEETPEYGIELLEAPQVRVGRAPGEVPAKVRMQETRTSLGANNPEALNSYMNAVTRRARVTAQDLERSTLQTDYEVSYRNATDLESEEVPMEAEATYAPITRQQTLTRQRTVAQSPKKKSSMVAQAVKWGVGGMAVGTGLGAGMIFGFDFLFS